MNEHLEAFLMVGGFFAVCAVHNAITFRLEIAFWVRRNGAALEQAAREGRKIEIA